MMRKKKRGQSEISSSALKCFSHKTTNHKDDSDLSSGGDTPKRTVIERQTDSESETERLRQAALDSEAANLRRKALESSAMKT